MIGTQRIVLALAQEAADRGWVEKAKADEAKFKNSGLTLNLLEVVLNGTILDKIVKAPYPNGGTIKVWLDPGSRTVSGSAIRAGRKKRSAPT